MDDLKLKAIDYFAAKPHDDKKAKAYLDNVYEEIHGVLVNSISYDCLSSSLSVLERFISHVSKKSIDALVCCWYRLHEVEELSLGDPSLVKFQRKDKIYSRIITLLGQLRYLEQDKVTDVLFTFWREDESHRVEVERVFKELAEFNLYAIDKIGFEPQLKILEKIKNISDEERVDLFPLAVCILNQLLSTDIEGHEWHYRTVTIKSMAIPASEQVESIRNDTVSLLIVLYDDVSSIEDKKILLNIMNEACRSSSRSEISDEASLIIEKNSIDILGFWASVVEKEPLELVQKIEYNSYWTYYHTTSQLVKQSALLLREAIDSISEYKIYRDLVGYEGVFYNWEDRDSVFDYESQSKYREDNLRSYIDSISTQNLDEWIRRVDVYLTTESKDLATFPYLFKFVEEASCIFPGEFLNALDSRPNLIKAAVSIFRGVWRSPQQKYFSRKIIEWLENGSYLWEISIAFSNFEGLEYDLINKFVKSCLNFEDVQSLSSLFRVINAENIKLSKDELNHLVSDIFSFLNEKESTSWIGYTWFTNKGDSFFLELSEYNLNLIVDNLVFVKDFDYQLEGVFENILNISVDSAFLLIEKRIEYKERIPFDELGRYDEIPFNFVSANKVLSNYPDRILNTIKNNYDPKYSFLNHSISSLFRKCFPVFDDNLIDVITCHLNPLDTNELNIILSIVKSYEGHTSIYPLVKEILKKIDCSDHNIRCVRVALNSTGVVTGEYGFVNALNLRLEEVTPWLDDDDANVVKFTYKYIESLKEEIEQETKRVDERVAIEKHRYGEEDK
ncbi:hypothetical protein ACEV8Q_13120 [Vibrio parahaemolyticus]